MDLTEIRKDISAALGQAGWNAWYFSPEDAKAVFPAAIVNPPARIEYGASLKLARAEVPITLAVSLASYEDAQRRLDAAVSPGHADSVVDVLNALTSTHWSGELHVVGVENVRLVAPAPGQAANALALDVIVNVTATKRSESEGS